MTPNSIKQTTSQLPDDVKCYKVCIHMYKQAFNAHVLLLVENNLYSQLLLVIQIIKNFNGTCYHSKINAKV